MHRQTTVRGAGLGFVLVTVAFWGGFGAALGLANPLGRWAICCALATVMVAVVSWMDDRRGLPVWPRLAVHVVAAVFVTYGALPSLLANYPPIVVCAVPVVLILPAINFWNFIDGINGLAASQALIAGLVVTLSAFASGDIPAAFFGAVLAGSLLGFLPFNFPNARAFMGDVGSASLGLMVVSLALMPIAEVGASLPVALLLIAAVFLDAGLTLLWRMLRRPPRRWYTAHREHLYQWLTRAGWGHTRTTLSYLVFSLVTAAIILIIGPQQPTLMLIAAVSLYLFGALIWRLGRDYALKQLRSRI